jgi:two-component system, chemotaxis family, protein-glutamate methylesterase/glutaminase
MEKDRLKGKFSVAVIGGSAGSLEVIISMLQGLRNMDLALIIVIHRKGTLHSTLAELLNLRSVVKVKEAEEKEEVRAGYVYIAPADYHLLIEKNGTLSLDYSEKVNFSRPSIDVTFECAAQVYGDKVIGVLLSGGNADGVEGMKKIKKAGGLCVIQDPATALVSFMPQHARNEVEIDMVLPEEKLATLLNDIA